MSLPNNTVSALPIAGLFISPDDQVSKATEDFEQGGVAVQNSTEGLSSYRWRLWLENGSDVLLKRDGASEILLFQMPGITELSLAFDQAMRPHVAYTVSGTLFLRWYDSYSAAYVTTNFGAGRNPRLCLDDKRSFMIDRSDVIFAYLKSGSLCYRQQRDRFEIERVLRTGVIDSIRLKNIGLNKNLRLQFELV